MTQRPGPYRELVTGRTFDALARLEAMASGRGISMAGLALAWLLADERVTQIVIGPGRPEHLAPVEQGLDVEGQALVEDRLVGVGQRTAFERPWNQQVGLGGHRNLLGGIDLPHAGRIR